MKRSIFGVLISLTIPLLLFINVWQSQRYMTSYFEVRGLITRQDNLVKDNKILISRVAELESPSRVVSFFEGDDLLKKIGGGEIVRIEVIDSDK